MQIVFITVLVATTYLPPTGWLQWTKSFTDKKVCEDVIRAKHEEIAAAVEMFMQAKFERVIEMRCMPYAEAERLNVELGHR